MKSDRIAAILADSDFIAACDAFAEQATRKVMARSTDEATRAQLLAEFHGMHAFLAHLRAAAQRDNPQ